MAIIAFLLVEILLFQAGGRLGGPALLNDGLPSAAAAPTPSSPAPTPTLTATALASATPAPAPAWTNDLAGQLECDGPIASLGGEVGQVGSFDPVPSPDEALALVLQPGLYASLPLLGWQVSERDGHWARHRYTVGGHLKALAVSTDLLIAFPPDSGWDVVGLLACDASEFASGDGLTDRSTMWLDADGKPVRADFLFSRLGPEHCGWEHVTFLEFDGQQYLRDVEGVLARETARSFRVVRALPSGAIDSGFHTTVLRLYTVSDGQSVYVKSTKGTIERWGRATQPIGCS